MFVSIHASHRMQPSNPELSAISTHTPLAGVQLVTPPNASVSIEFQPIHPIRDATISMQAATIQYNISPLHPCVVQL